MENFIHKFAITGAPGTGSSTVTEAVATLMSKLLGVKITTFSSGQYCRHLAEEAGYPDIRAFNRAMAENPDPSFDKMIDEAVKAALTSLKSMAIDSRLAPWFGSENVFKVRLVCNSSTAAHRIFRRTYHRNAKGKEELQLVQSIEKKEVQRFKDENTRYGRMYQYNPAHPVNLEIDTTSLKPSVIAEIILYEYILWYYRRMRQDSQRQ